MSAYARAYFGVNRPRQLSHPRIAARLGPDLDQQPSFLRRLGENMFPQTTSHRLPDMPIVGHQLGEGLSHLDLIELA
jgi:hypothetical protein